MKIPKGQSEVVDGRRIDNKEKKTKGENNDLQYIESWFNQIENSPRAEFYGISKNEFNLEKYLLKLLPHERNMITKLRCSNIKLPIETGRWSMTPREERICHLCNVGLRTEFHFLFECTSADVQRLICKCIPIYYTRYANMYKMKGLLSLCNVKVLKKLSLFISKLQNVL